MEEVGPVVDIVPERHLVGDESDDDLLAFLPHLDDLSQGLRHRDADGTQAVAQVEEELVECRILQDMVNLSEGDVFTRPQG